MTTIAIKTQSVRAERRLITWRESYTGFAAALAALAAVISTLEMAWPFKIALFYLGFLAAAWFLIRMESRG